jgi:NAD(P)-dependent dehydrogenase (short-subunit alcohol dehydrogenase family)
MSSLKGKTALVTGGNSGIGYATAKELKAQGAEVIITGRRKDAVEKAAAELGVTGIVADQGQVAAIEKLATEIRDQFGKIDILFVNAGVLTLTTIENATEQAFDDSDERQFQRCLFYIEQIYTIVK